ncbi:MAG: TraR/DksA family transcriptional regulator [Alphaproteobacteria bacterium]|nr:MAG: TraR/DksA family transcriptional regulator [Alphaproteobacteria bacterium]
MSLRDDLLLRLRNRLIEELAALEEAETLGRDGQRTVELDQQAVGRLSRMDALQSQAMSRAGAEVRARRRRAIAAALARMDEGEYGYCCECGEAIAPRRLEIDPAAAVCVSCAAAR